MARDIREFFDAIGAPRMIKDFMLRLRPDEPPEVMVSCYITDKSGTPQMTNDMGQYLTYFEDCVLVPKNVLTPTMLVEIKNAWQKRMKTCEV